MQVRPGIEVLLADSAHLIAGQRLGLLTNHTGVDREGRRDVDLLRAAHGTRLTVLYSPEHGFAGTEDRPGLPDGVDSATGLPIYSLYGGSRTAARPAALDSIDVLLIDLQDIGARYYTYISTATSLLRAATRAGKRVVVLDRPNPIGGRAVQGNVRPAAGDPDSAAAFVGFLPVAMRHGMTFGELARMANDVLAIGADLVVVPAAGWERGMLYDATALPWVRPSPNMPELESALLYPGLCLFEGTNVSVARGTGFAFQMIGAPWLDAEAVLRRLVQAPDWRRARGSALAGVEVQRVVFTPRRPTDGKYDGERLSGLRVRVVDAREHDPTRLAVALLAAIRAVHPESLQFRPQSFDRLAAGPELRRALEAGTPAWEIWG
ncbi:MAG: exo-beta-N-acetylmuramidase NamZ family protein, partial [Gemmatimonadales bacterium]